MFVTNKEFLEWMPKELSPPGNSFYKVISLNGFTPWYLVTHRATANGCLHRQTLLVSWESTLIDVLSSLGGDAIEAIEVVSITEEARTRWRLLSVRTVWLATESEACDTGPLIFAVVGEQSLLDSFQCPVQTKSEERRLLFDLNDPGELRDREAPQ